MSLRDDVRYEIHKHYEPKVPNEKVILEQAKSKISKGRSTGNISLDIKAIKSLNDDKEER